MKTWQDLVLGIGNIFFVIGPAIAVIDHDPPSVGTSVLLAVGLTAFPPTLYSLGLRVTPVITAIEAVLWWMLVAQAVQVW